MPTFRTDQFSFRYLTSSSSPESTLSGDPAADPAGLNGLISILTLPENPIKIKNLILPQKSKAIKMKDSIFMKSENASKMNDSIFMVVETQLNSTQY